MRRRLTILPLTLISVAALGAAGGSSHSAASARFSQPRLSAGTPRGGTANYGWSSSNWSGYAITGGSGSFHAITGHWTVTAVSATNRASYSSSWIGIDGYNNSNLIQTGTEADYYSGSAHYGAWWEILPAAETVIPSITVRPGDHLSASITKGSGSSWSITISDTTSGQSFTTTQSYSGPQTSAEWIQEAPQVGGRIAQLAHYGLVTFDPGTVNGVDPGLTSADSGIMVQKNAQVSTPSNPDSEGDGFNCRYGSTQPAPPSS